MSVPLSDLVARLRNEVEPRGAVPNASGYEESVKAAVATFSLRVPLERRTSIDIESGTAEYTLPADFRKLIRLEGLQESWSNSGVALTSQGMVPLMSTSASGSAFLEEIEILGQILIIHPMPTYAWDGRVVWYAAIHVLDAESEYPYLIPDGAEISAIMLKAQANAVGLIANAFASSTMSTSWDQLRTELGVPMDVLRHQINALTKEFEARCKELAGPAGTWAKYTDAELSAANLYRG